MVSLIDPLKGHYTDKTRDLRDLGPAHGVSKARSEPIVAAPHQTGEAQ